MSTLVKVAVITGDVQDSEYYDTFIPHYISDWEEIEQDQVDKVRKGLQEMSRNAPIAQRKWHYRLVVAPVVQKGIIAQALTTYDMYLKKEDEIIKKREREKAKTERQVALKKKRSELKKTLKLLASSPNKDVISALEIELKEVENDLKKTAIS